MQIVYNSFVKLPNDWKKHEYLRSAYYYYNL